MNNVYLHMAAAANGIAALLHLGCIVFGAPWYRFFGAGEGVVQLALAGSRIPDMMAAGIAALLGVWGLYALSGAGVVIRLPLLRLALCVITGVFLARAVLGFAFAAFSPGERGALFWVWSSIICLGISALHLAGTMEAWKSLSAPPGVHPSVEQTVPR